MNDPTDPHGADEEPLTALTAEAAQHFEIYTTYVKVGFTEGQALDIVKTIVATIICRAA